MPGTPNREVYLSFLTEQGYRPEVDTDGDVSFMKEGGHYYILVDEKDPAYFRLCYPNFWSVESEDERRRVLQACDYANRRSKAAKLFTVKDDTWASIEMFLSDSEGFKAIFDRALSALQNGVLNFKESMRGPGATSTGVGDGGTAAK